MKQTFRSLILLAVFAVLHAFPTAVHAADANQLANQMGGISGLSAVVDAGTANTVIVTGSAPNARGTLVLAIDAGVTVR